MVAKEVLNAKRPVPIAFGDFPAIPVGIPTQKLSLSLGGAGNHLNEPTKDARNAEQSNSDLSGGNGRPPGRDGV